MTLSKVKKSPFSCQCSWPKFFILGVAGSESYNCILGCDSTCAFLWPIHFSNLGISSWLGELKCLYEELSRLPGLFFLRRWDVNSSTRVFSPHLDNSRVIINGLNFTKTQEVNSPGRRVVTVQDHITRASDSIDEGWEVAIEQFTSTNRIKRNFQTLF